MTRFLAIFGLSLTCFLAGCSVSSYDTKQFQLLERAILRSTNNMVALSVEEASQKLAIQSVRWDSGCIPQTGDQLRIYHFEGFCLKLPLTHDGRSDTNWCVAVPGPTLEIDRIKDPNTRMSNYWDNVSTMFRKADATSRIVEKNLGGETNR